MNPERSKTINGTQIEEYYWGGKFVVYINNRATELTFEKACDKISKQVLIPRAEK